MFVQYTVCNYTSYTYTLCLYNTQYGTTQAILVHYVRTIHNMELHNITVDVIFNSDAHCSSKFELIIYSTELKAEFSKR